MKIRDEYTFPLELTHDITRGKWKPIILWQLGKGPSSLTGTMEVLETQDVKEMIWREGDTMYYPLGVTDPDYCVLRFTARTGRYYDNFKSENFVVE